MTAVFPSLPGLTLEVDKTPTWGTRRQRAVSGRETRTGDYVNPIWQFTLSFDFLRDGSDMRAGPGIGEGVGYNELRTMMGFFNQQQGSLIPFLFEDPSDNAVIGATILPLPTDQTGRLLQLARGLYGGFAEAIVAPNAVTAIYNNGGLDPGATVDPNTGIVTLSSGATGPVTADFTFSFLVRFTKDVAQFHQFSYQLWELKQIELTSVIL